MDSISYINMRIEFMSIKYEVAEFTKLEKVMLMFDNGENTGITKFLLQLH